MDTLLLILKGKRMIPAENETYLLHVYHHIVTARYALFCLHMNSSCFLYLLCESFVFSLGMCSVVLGLISWVIVSLFDNPILLASPMLSWPSNTRRVTTASWRMPLFTSGCISTTSSLS